MGGDIIEFGAMPTDDPTLEDGAVMVHRSTSINHLVEVAMAQLGRDDMGVPTHLRFAEARQAVLALISGDPEYQSHVEWDDTCRRLAAGILLYIKQSTGIDYNRYRMNLYLAMVYGNTLVVVYGIFGAIQ